MRSRGKVSEVGPSCLAHPINSSDTQMNHRGKKILADGGLGYHL